ncbi:MAG TPA: alkaline phosphatase family protein [Hanamia sp.]|jgi:phosphatidylinositol-3-phosphatase|nr:alkaline phosphatase family protein [Hanamia sp.]
MYKARFVIISLFAAAFCFISCKSKIKLPKPSHIVVIVEENHGFDQIIGSENAPYINQLAKEGTLFTNSEAITHPSQPNYLALFSGSTQNVDGDECLMGKGQYVTPNLGAALIKAGYTFKGYSETLPKVGFQGCSYQQKKGYNYARKHAPWVNWQGDKENGLPDSTNQPLTDFPTDFNKLPTVSFVIPNEGNDMHNIDLDGDSAAIKRADQWLKDHLSSYVQWARKNNSLLILTFDEDQKGSMLSNHIATIFVGEMVKNKLNSNSISHYNVLRTIEDMYRLPPSGNGNARTIDDIWN